MARIARTPSSQSDSLARPPQGQDQDDNRQRAEPEGSPFSRLANEAIALVSDQLQKQVHRPAADLDRLARALQLTSEQLAGTLAVPVVARAAAEAERAARFLEQNDARQTLEAVERFARQKPLLFLGGALAIGVGAGRFLKSSGFETGSSTSNPSPTARRQATASPQTTQRGNDHEPQQAQQDAPHSKRRAGTA